MVDKICPAGQFFFWDAMISSLGDFRCKALGKEWEGVGQRDYPICKSDCYLTCDRYLAAKSQGRLDCNGNLIEMVSEECK